MGPMKVLAELESPERQARLLVFSDLDGTLLDDSYRWEAATPALDLLKSLGFPLVLSSSKTLDEMMELVGTLATNAPLIAENGAIVASPPDKTLLPEPDLPDTPLPYGIESNGLGRAEILAIAHELREREGYKFEGFSDWTVGQVVEHTGLSAEQAERSIY